MLFLLPDAMFDVEWSISKRLEGSPQSAHRRLSDVELAVGGLGQCFAGSMSVNSEGQPHQHQQMAVHFASMAVACFLGPFVAKFHPTPCI